MLRSPTPRQRATATNNSQERKSQPYPGMSPVLVVRCRVVIPETIYTQTTKTDSADSIYIFAHTHIYVYIYAYDNNFKRCYQLEGGMERLEGGTWRVWKEGGKRRKWHIPISIKDILKAFKMPGIFPPDFKHSYPIMLHPGPFQSAKPYFQILRATQRSNDIFRLYILYVYYTKHLSPCSVLSISICTSKGLWNTQNGFPTQLTLRFHTATHVSVRTLLATEQASGISAVLTRTPAFSSAGCFSNLATPPFS